VRELGSTSDAIVMARCWTALLAGAALAGTAQGFAVQPGAQLRGSASTISSHAVMPAAVAMPRSTPTSMMLPAIGILPAQTTTALGLNTFLAAVGTLKGQKVLTPMGLAHAWALGVMLWASLGLRGWGTCVCYFAGGVLVTKIGKSKKEALGIAEGRGGMRGPENVWGSAATAAACALATMRWPARAALLQMGFVAALATKLSDTCASEIGKAYGTDTYLITTLRKCKPGDEGGVSLEGTAAGVVGSVVLSCFGVAVGLVSKTMLLPLMLAAFIATNIESLIGAVFQDNFKLLTNEVVNGIMTVVGAAVGMALGVALGV
jgi:uncharacterized protein (TIGR00297 family)